MTTLATLAIILGSIMTYLVMIGITYVVFRRKTDFDRADRWAAGISWPVMLPGLMLRSVPIFAAQRIERWLDRPKAAKLPKAKAVNK